MDVPQELQSDNHLLYRTYPDRLLVWRADNREFGIKAGQYVDLFVVNFRVGVFGAPLFVLPTDLGSDESTAFNNILNDHSEHIYNIIKKLPENVYNVVFGDETYCPEDFAHQRTSTNYY